METAAPDHADTERFTRSFHAKLKVDKGRSMSETRKIAAILVSDVAGYGRLAGADEERTLARLRALRSDLIDPTIAEHHGGVVKRTGDGFIVEFRSVVEAVRCATEFQSAMVDRNAGVPPEHRIEFRIGIHLGDVVEESDGDLMGEAVNIAARLEGICEPGGICLSGAAYEHVRERVKETFADLGEKVLKNITRPVRVYAVQAGMRSPASPPLASDGRDAGPPRLSIVVLPFANTGGDPEQEYFADGVTESLTTDLSRMGGTVVIGRSTAFTYKGKAVDLKQIGRDLNVRFILEGSIQVGRGRMRVNVQLIDTGRAAISGRRGSISLSPISSTCKTKSSHGWPPSCKRTDCCRGAARGTRRNSRCD